MIVLLLLKVYLGSQMILDRILPFCFKHPSFFSSGQPSCLPNTCLRLSCLGGMFFSNCLGTGAFSGDKFPGDSALKVICLIKSHKHS